MSKVVSYAEKLLWGTAGLAVSLILLFAILHFLKNNSLTGGISDWVGTHAQNY
jgi:hypothetical protein